MIEQFDIAVLGGGPAGMAAASLAATSGARTVLLDENAVPGGQVYRAPAGRIAHGADGPIGDQLREALTASGAEVRAGCLVWNIGGGPIGRAAGHVEPFSLDAIGGGQPFTVTSRALILCPGTHERVIPFPGWTLPGVFGLAAATILLKAQGVLPGQRTVVAGCGPLLAAVGSAIMQAGGEVAAVVDAAPRRAWLRALPALATRPRLAARGALWMAAIRRAGVPWLSGHRIAIAHGDTEVTSVDVAPMAGGAARRLACDAACVGHGLVPATEAARVLRAHLVYRPARGGWVPVLDPEQRSSVPFVYVAGDGAGVSGAAVAPVTGRIAALAALADLGLAESSHQLARLHAERAAGARFASAMAAMMAVRPALVAAIPAECVVCRCEDVTRADIEAAIDAGARDVNQLKQFTRCGMGPCQGRMCGEAAGELVAARVGGREAAGIWTGRVPLRPVPLAPLLGGFDYGDIPVPAPAPI